jgi:hypothetical protein
MMSPATNARIRRWVLVKLVDAAGREPVNPARPFVSVYSE